MIESEVLLGLPEYELTAVEERARQIHLRAQFVGRISCAHCGEGKRRAKDRRTRRLRHENWGMRKTVLELETRKWRCRACGRSFW